VSVIFSSNKNFSQVRYFWNKKYTLYGFFPKRSQDENEHWIRWCYFTDSHVHFR